MINPTGFYVLVLPDDMTDVDPELKRAKSFGFELPEDQLAREQAAAVTGTVVAVGPLAWKASGLGGEDWVEIGSRVFFPRHGHTVLTDPDDDKTYFLIEDQKVLSEYKEGVRDA